MESKSFLRRDKMGEEKEEAKRREDKTRGGKIRSRRIGRERGR